VGANEGVDVFGTEDSGDGFVIVRKNNVIERIRPTTVLLQRPEAYALYVSTEGMLPVFRPGDTILADRMMPIVRDTEVVVSDDNGQAIIGTLVAYDRDAWTIELLQPSDRKVLKRGEWPHCHRIVAKLYRR
jgi:phage repressor protein C with HTH and peptisase S24 domain